MYYSVNQSVYGLNPDDEELQVAMIVQTKTMGGRCISILYTAWYRMTLVVLLSKCALSCPCQAHLTTAKGILSYPGTRVPGYPVDTVATPSNAMLAGGELHPWLL